MGLLQNGTLSDVVVAVVVDVAVAAGSCSWCEWIAMWPGLFSWNGLPLEKLVAEGW